MVTGRRHRKRNLRRRRGGRRVSLAGLLALAAAAGAAALGAQARPLAPAVGLRPLIVSPGPAAARWTALLRASGASARRGTLAEGLRRGAVVVPAGAALGEEEVHALRRLVAGGGRVVTADTTLLPRLGIRLGRPERLRTVQMLGVAGPVRWDSALWIRPLHATPPAAVRRLAWSGDDVVLADVRLGRGRGRVLAAAVDPFADGRLGYETLPALGRLAASVAGAAPGPRRDAVELYVDPGTLRHDPEQIAALVAGARSVFVAGWNTGFLDPRFDYPYDRLLRALHARGIRAYAWLEPPFVNLRVWNEHPECREKDSAGRDAVDDWRALFALEDDRCFELAWSVWRDLLARFDFDGVNVSELYYANVSLPWHASALAQFGADPAARPADWLRFREDLVLRLNAKIARRVQSLGRPLDVVVTTVDDRLDPQLGARIGVDVRRTAALARELGAGLQVEDPYTTWTRGPERYVRLARSLRPLLPGRSAYVDVNVVPREYAYPTPTMTAAELDLSLADAGSSSGRVAVYSAATLAADDDRVRLGRALAAAAVTGDTELSSPWSVVVSSPLPGRDRLRVDGRPWPSHAGSALVPAGRHSLGWSEGEDAGPALLRLAAELLDERASAGRLELAYDAVATAWAVVDRAPASVNVDGVDRSVETLAGPGGSCALRLPAGRHAVRILFRAAQPAAQAKRGVETNCAAAIPRR